MVEKSLQITNLGDTKKDKKYAVKSYILPTSDPWIVEINGHNYPVSSAVVRLLLHLAKKAKKAPK